MAEDKEKNKEKNHKKKKISEKDYEKELEKLQLKLVEMQDWVKKYDKKVVVLFEGRDSAGKGGMIKRITAPLNHRICRVAALATPTDREKTQWYFQRYVAHLPSAGEIVLFDRSWYNRAGVEKVMGFCTDAQYKEFLRICPGFEETLINSGTILIKYYLSVSAGEQKKRFEERIENPMKRWKISPMDMYARSRWYDYSEAKDGMFRYTDTKLSPWYVVNTDDKKSARLNCISHLLSLIPYKKIKNEKLKLPPLQKEKAYIRPPMKDQTFIPEKY